MILAALDDVTIMSDNAFISAEQFMYDKTIWSGCLSLNFLNSSDRHDSSKEHPALISGNITVLLGLRIFATSAINLTPQKTITSASVAWAFLDKSKESPIKTKNIL